MLFNWTSRSFFLLSYFCNLELVLSPAYIIFNPQSVYPVSKNFDCLQTGVVMVAFSERVLQLASVMTIRASSGGNVIHKITQEMSGGPFYAGSIISLMWDQVVY